MALPTAAPLALSDALAEFGKPATAGLSALAGIAAFRHTTPVTLPAANVIKLSDLYGLSPHSATIAVAIAPATWAITLPATGTSQQTFTATTTPATTSTWAWFTQPGWPSWMAFTRTGNTAGITILHPNDVPVGRHTFTFHATATHGGVTDDEFATVTVTRLAPTATITSPAVGGTWALPTSPASALPITTAAKAAVTPAGGESYTYRWYTNQAGMEAVTPTAASTAVRFTGPAWGLRAYILYCEVSAGAASVTVQVPVQIFITP